MKAWGLWHTARVEDLHGLRQSKPPEATRKLLLQSGLGPTALNPTCVQRNLSDLEPLT